jgi:hypothetical protein
MSLGMTRSLARNHGHAYDLRFLRTQARTAHCGPIFPLMSSPIDKEGLPEVEPNSIICVTNTLRLSGLQDVPRVGALVSPTNAHAGVFYLSRYLVLCGYSERPSETGQHNARLFIGNRPSKAFRRQLNVGVDIRELRTNLWPLSGAKASRCRV